MKKLKRPARKEKRSTHNGATRGSKGRDSNSSVHGLPHPKTELESAIQRFVDLYDFAPIAYVSFDRAGRIEEANLAATELLGQPGDLLIGRPFAFYVADLDLFLRHLLYCRTSQQQVKTDQLLSLLAVVLVIHGLLVLLWTRNREDSAKMTIYDLDVLYAVRLKGRAYLWLMALSVAVLPALARRAIEVEEDTGFGPAEAPGAGLLRTSGGLRLGEAQVVSLPQPEQAEPAGPEHLPARPAGTQFLWRA